MKTGGGVENGGSGGKLNGVFGVRIANDQRPGVVVVLDCVKTAVTR